MNRLLYALWQFSWTGQYSDGDIENDLLQLIMEEPDVEKILAEDDRWPVLYHFSPVRQNILEWYPFKKDASVLEIGAGCGAISGVLCRNAKHVTSVDLSKRRSLINANRNKEYDNLTIMVGNFNDVVLKEKYDYITLIGVLEYAGYYTDDEHPFEAFLKKISGYLKEAGIETKLIEGIEPDPSVETVMRGAKVMQEFEPDLIIAMGGGSPIDAAKAMWVFYEHPQTTFDDIKDPFTIPPLRNKATSKALSINMRTPGSSA